MVGCSGGPDSTALLLALAALRGELALGLHAVYVDHGLRAAAAAEAEHVRALAAQQGVGAEAVRVVLPTGPSRMGVARQARYAALLEVARRQGAEAVAVGHTRTDQAETVIMRLLGGAGLRGLGGMPPRRPLGEGVQLVRPLLQLDRADVDAFLAEAGVVPLVDPSNNDPRYLRSRLRHQVLPRLRQERPDLDAHLGDLAERLRQDADCLEELAARALADLLREGEMEVARLQAQPRALQARILRLWLGPLGHRHIDAALQLLERGGGTRSIDLPGRRRLERVYGQLRLVCAAGQAQPEPDPAAEVPLPVPGTGSLAGVCVRLSLHPPGAALPPPSAEVALFDAAQVQPPLVLRHPRAGDRIQLRAGRRRLSDWLIDARVPRTQRRQLVLLCQGDAVLWVVGLRAAALGPATDPAGATLVAEWLRPQGAAADMPGANPMPPGGLVV